MSTAAPQQFNETLASECATCGDVIPLKEHTCTCDEINETMESLKTAADNRGMHKELLASLRVVLRGIQAI